MNRSSQASDDPAAVYLDHAATSPLRPRVWEAMRAAVGEADLNPASSHRFGRKASTHLESARGRLAACLDVDKRHLRFTGGGTQSDNLAVLGFARAHRDASPRLLVSAIEHKAVLHAARQAGEEGARVDTIPVDGTGTVDLDALADLLAEGDGAPTLVSVMWANNEVGTVQPVAEAAEIAHEHGARFHTDAVQAVGKCPVSLRDVAADLATVTAHKLGGPVGIGLLHVADDVDLHPLTHGGSQEKGLWPGTQNPLAALGFAEAAARAVEARPDAADRWRRLRDRLADVLRAEIADLVIHGEEAPERLPNVLSVGIPGCDTSALLVSMDLEGVAVSSGSACSSGSSAPSHVLEAMGVRASPDEYGVIRFSFGPDTSDGDVDRAADVLPRVAGRLRDSEPARA